MESPMLELLAEAPDPLGSNSFVSAMAGAFSGVGFSLWYGWYCTCRLIPKLVDDFRQERVLDREDRKSERDEFKSALKAIVTTIEMVPCQAVYEEIRRREAAQQHPSDSKWQQPMSLQPHGGV
jgi:hypothetical protein